MFHRAVRIRSPAPTTVVTSEANGFVQFMESATTECANRHERRRPSRLPLSNLDNVEVWPMADRCCRSNTAVRSGGFSGTNRDEGRPKAMADHTEMTVKKKIFVHAKQWERSERSAEGIVWRA